MTCAAVTEDQHRTKRSGELIAHRQTLEAVTAHQLFTSLRRVVGFRVRVDHAGGDERFLHGTPAAGFGTGVGAFLGDGGRATQPRIEARIDARIRVNDRHAPVMANDASGTGETLWCLIIESRSGRGQPFRPDLDRGESKAEATKKNQQEKSSHALCVCKARTTVASVFLPRWRTILRISPCGAE
jgi:hypothetical protein